MMKLVPSWRSRIGLDAANFFQAEAVGVVLPVLDTFLKESHWGYEQIGIATALLGFGTLLFQTPAGILVDRLKSRRTLCHRVVCSRDLLCPDSLRATDRTVG